MYLQGNKNTDFDLARVPYINANDEHKLSKSSPGYSHASCFREGDFYCHRRFVLCFIHYDAVLKFSFLKMQMRRLKRVGW